jgi:ATP-binding cassette subfamily D (ALD) protein 3
MQDLVKLLEIVQLGYLVYREGGLDSVNEWNDILSGSPISIIFRW